MRIIIFYVVWFSFTALLSAQAYNNGNLNTILEQVYNNDPKLASFTKARELETVKIAGVSNLPDPKITLGLTNMPVNTFSFSQEPMTGKTIAISQSFPFFGKLSLAENLQMKSAELIDPEIKLYKLQLDRKVKLLYWDVIANNAKTGLTNDLIDVVAGVEDLIATRYSYDLAKKQDLVAIRLELTLLNDKLEMFRGASAEGIAALATLAGKDTMLTSENFPEIPETLPINQEEAEEIINRENPDIIKSRIALEQAGMREELARKDYWPDFTITLQYTMRDELKATGKDQADFLSVMAGFNIPLNYGGKTDAKIDEARLSGEILSDRINSIQLNASSEAAKATQKLNSILKRINITKNILLPQSEENLSAALSGAGTGVTDYLSVINAVQKIIEVKLKYIELKTAYYTALTNLEYILGTDLNGVENE